MSAVRVRFAPSPTGSLHIGGARTALFNWLYARKHGGSFILRLEDTDIERNQPQAYKNIIESLKWLGLDWDEGPEKEGPYGPYQQSRRLHIYQREASRLLEAGLAYPCYCTPEQLAKDREAAQAKGIAPHYCGRCRDLSARERKEKEDQGIRPALRIKVPAEAIYVDDLVRGQVVFQPDSIDDFIIMKGSGVPTYHFACVVDDTLMQISHVIRAEEHLSNTPKQLVLYNALGFTPPVFVHVSMILAPDRSKLSKRHGATGVEEFRQDGFLAEALVNYLAFLGWSTGDEREILSRQEMVELFSLDSLTKHAAIYDVQKLTWLCAHYLKELPLEEIAQRAWPYFTGAGLISPDAAGEENAYYKKVVDTVRTRVHTLVELKDASYYFFHDDFTYEEKGVRKFFHKPGVRDLLISGRQALEKAEPFDASGTEKAYRELIDSLNISGSTLIHPTRLALSGRTVGPGLFDIIAVLGRKRCLSRLDRAIKLIETDSI